MSASLFILVDLQQELGSLYPEQGVSTDKIYEVLVSIYPTIPPEQFIKQCGGDPLGADYYYGKVEMWSYQREDFRISCTDIKAKFLSGLRCNLCLA